MMMRNGVTKNSFILITLFVPDHECTHKAFFFFFMQLVESVFNIKKHSHYFFE